MRPFLLHMIRPQENGRHRHDGARFLLVLVALLGVLTSRPSLADELDELLRYAKAGAPQLSIQLVQERQPHFASDLQGWLRWEKALVELMRNEGQWSLLEVRFKALPSAALPAEARRWFESQQAITLLNLGRYVEARALLRERSWSDSTADARTIAQWRHLIIQSYLQQGLTNDAYDAMLRYRQDYGAGDRDAMLLRAEVLLRNGRPLDARAQLTDIGEEREAPALRLLAALRAGDKPRDIVREAQNRLKQAPGTSRLKLLLLGVMAEANERLGDHAARAIALEQFYADPNHARLAAGLFTFTADSLWKSYLAYGLEVGNREQMLMGDDPAWFKTAASAVRQYPVRARSLYTVMAEQAVTAEGRLMAHRALLEQLGGKERKPELVKALYLESRRFGEERALPIPVRYFLYDAALAQGELELASRMLRTLERAPDEVTSFDWEVRGAKVFMLSGDYLQAAQTLARLLEKTPALNTEQFDRVMQLLFDMQTVGEHARAIALFEKLLQRPQEPQTERELFYWIADSRLAQQHYLEAAQNYLRSAILPGEMAMDPWAETARYQAAKALAQAGLIDDARNLYRQLLEVTTDPSRRAVLQHELEQLRLATKH